MGKTAIIIPARYNSKRLNGKPLIKVCDKPIIQWVWERAKSVKGSDRIAEVAERHPDFDIIVNLQGDEPMIDPLCVEEVIKNLKNDPNADITTLCTFVRAEDDKEDPNMVKVVFDCNNYALYFSRSKIPYERNYDIADFYKHIGIYGYRRESLFKMIKLDQPKIERAESLEQLRALYNGMKIKVSPVVYDSVGIDTIDDLNAFKKIVENK